ncbi:MAG: oligoendopeptidase F family protein [Bacilli bacterium]|nr:oligoendopeptidase F family protein [Bacilli bacterium]MDD4795056.1 oligoendopeptidase F family protein [Bacilli bacterium]
MNYDKREDVPDIYKWDLTTRYKNDDAFEKDYQKNLKSYQEITKYQGKVLESSKTLLDALNKYFKIKKNILKLYVYANCKLNENVEDSKNELRLNKALSLYYKFIEASSYLKPEILKGSKSVLTKYLKTKNLKPYQFYLENIIREKEHTLSQREEMIISKLSSTSDLNEKISEVLTNSVIDYGTIIVDGEETQLTNANYRNIITNKDRNTRKEAFEKITNNIKTYESIYGMNLAANMKYVKNLAEVYNFKTVLEMDLFASNIPTKVVSNLYTTVEKRLDILRKYFLLIKQNLALDQLEYYDIKAEIVSTDLTFTIEEARLILENSLSILGNDYLKILKRAFDEKWIDFGTYKGKTSSIYATCNYGNTPLVSTNFLGKFQDISTLAHELGHAINFELSGIQPIQNWNGSLLTAEVASLTNEILVSDYIIKKASDKNLKLTAISSLLDTIQNNLFDACIEGKFENIIYAKLEAGEEVNADAFNETIYEIRKSYYGDSVILDNRVKSMWIRRMHYFSPYYLFKYATGISSAIYIATNIIANKNNMKEKYLEFLTYGGSDYPTNLLEKIGVDLTKPKVINEALDYMDYLINEFMKVSEEHYG